MNLKKTRILVRKAEFIKYTRIIKVRKAKLKKIAPQKSIFCGAILLVISLNSDINLQTDFLIEHKQFADILSSKS